jgi:Holliday junction resolvasome RuvABC endonuclease subunit
MHSLTIQPNDQAGGRLIPAKRHRSEREASPSTVPPVPTRDCAIGSRVGAIDPSSRCVGYCTLQGLRVRDLIESGLITPSTAKGAVDHLPPMERHWLNMRDELKALRRVESMLPDIKAWVERTLPAIIAVETPSGKTGTGAKHGARGALTTYGMAAGVVYAYLRHAFPGIVVLPVTERAWTTGAGSKDKRTMIIAAAYPAYDPASDAGGDAADAMGLARWILPYWLELAQEERA